MDRDFVSGYVSELAKIAQAPTMIPFGERLREHKEKLKAKAKETPLPHAKALGYGALGGAAIGGGSGYLAALSHNLPKTKMTLLGLGIGALGGALLSELQRAVHKGQIQRVKRIVNASDFNMAAKKDLINALDSHEKSKAFWESWDKDQKHEELVEAIKGR